MGPGAACERHPFSPNCEFLAALFQRSGALHPTRIRAPATSLAILHSNIFRGSMAHHFLPAAHVQYDPRCIRQRAQGPVFQRFPDPPVARPARTDRSGARHTGGRLPGRRQRGHRIGRTEAACSHRFPAARPAGPPACGPLAERRRRRTAHTHRVRRGRTRRPVSPHRPGAGRPPNFRPIPGPAFRYPHGYRYRRWTVGLFLPAVFFSSYYYYNDYWRLGLGAPPYGYRWVRYGPDLLLVEVRSRRVVDVVYGAFY